MDSSHSDSDDGSAGGVSNRSNEDDEQSPLVRDIVTSVAAVLLLGAYLFAMSGVWPPMVAIESGSMEPNMQVNDLTFVMDTDRFQPAESTTASTGTDTGVVTAATGAETGYSTFGNSGDVIVFTPNGNGARTPIIHRAMFWVEAGENWCQKEAANPAYLSGTNGNQCTASHSGFITKGDDNPTYDQAGNRITRPVRPEWVVGTAETRIPLLGWFRLQT
jgi:signal peptidase